ncbi:RNA-binding protein 48 [Mytilus coruscus]|uniref:RNA-binding protein 48 n=1 Tax=Mytilus coruscus TaxID=42192 RepID=A0A6J8BD27_MYTCO|nr:RNA-binding protein 48 [Mytilus coruscus]
MSAPMDGKSANIPTVPTHHIRLNLCATRPLYREGRNPKAVKVYTVNQESQYLMFQDVPALGTTQELIKLCAVHGAVEEYRLLDEFPTVDKFTDVVLVKFKRIQSARHAKKKLDNWSFYGGVLHVTYAPEYESVEETREKLQDRRKGIAARLRILGKDQSRRGKTFEGHTENDKPPPCCQQTLVIPPPPVREAFPNYSKINQNKTTFDFARVPTANAPFPTDYDGRIPQNVVAKEMKTQTHHDDPKVDAIKQNPSYSNKQGNLSHPKYNKILDKTGEKIIIKDFKKCGAMPKFIPRQTLNLLKAKSEHGEASNRDNLEMELRKNAVVLGSTQGPALVPEEFKKKEKSCTEKAVEHTVKEIRKRVSMFSSEQEDSTSEKGKNLNETDKCIHDHDCNVSI